MKTGNFPAGLVNYIMLYNIRTVKEVLETNIAVIPFGEHLPLSFGSCRKKNLHRENSFFLWSFLIEIIANIDSSQVFEIPVTFSGDFHTFFKSNSALLTSALQKFRCSFA